MMGDIVPANRSSVLTATGSEYVTC